MSALTSEKMKAPRVRQFAVFLKNKVGALREVVRILDEHNVVVLALSIAESSETAISRMIVSDPDRTAALFCEHEIAHSECELMVVELPGGPGDLSGVLAALLMAEVNVYFIYSLLVRPSGHPLLALHLDDLECATSVLLGEGFKLLNQGDLSR